MDAQHNTHEPSPSLTMTVRLSGTLLLDADYYLRRFILLSTTVLSVAADKEGDV